MDEQQRADALWREGVAAHRAGDLPRAEACYRQVAEAHPGHADAHYLLGMLALGRRDFHAAAERFGQAAAASPEVARYHLGLGKALYGLKAWAGAVGALQAAAACEPELAEAHLLLGGALSSLGRHPEAAAALARAAALQPEEASIQAHLAGALVAAGRYGEARAVAERAIGAGGTSAGLLVNYGAALRGLGEPAAAAEAFRRALEIDPGLVEAALGLAWALRAAGDPAGALAAAEAAAARAPEAAAPLLEMGEILAQLGRHEEAADALRKAAARNPEDAAVRLALGSSLHHLGRDAEAIAEFAAAAALAPRMAEAHYNLGVAEGALGGPDAGIPHYRKALELRPEYVEALVNLGDALRMCGRVGEGLPLTRRAVELRPQSSLLHSALLYGMLFADDTTAADLQAEEARWASRHVLPLLAKAALHERGREPERRLRIGYVSPDFREHPVARYLLPVFEAHDREAVEVVLYYTGSRRDAFTDRCRAAAGLWRECARVSDEAFAQRIREDGIDLLVDLSLHMAENRMLTFARKPAPVQISFSYPARTGSPAIDWRMSDEHLDPPGEDAAAAEAAGVAGPSPATRQGARRYAPEQVARIAAPHCFWCFDPHEEHGEAGVRPLPLLTSGYVTFGSLNNAAKTTPTAIAHWSGILRAVPRSRMVLLSGGGGAGGGAPTDSAIAAEFARRGIDPARVQFLPRGSRAAYLRHYGRIDIGIDPYPYTGHTTSCDAFWSGVPVLTLAGTGALPVARGGVSLLRTLGLPELIGGTPETLAEIAAALAGDVPRLRAMSETMRERMRSSPLMDAPGYTREVERLYRAAWRQWCEQGE